MYSIAVHVYISEAQANKHLQYQNTTPSTDLANEVPSKQVTLSGMECEIPLCSRGADSMEGVRHVPCRTILQDTLFFPAGIRIKNRTIFGILDQ